MTLTFAQAVNQSIRDIMAADRRAIAYGLGTPDGVFGTTAGLADDYPDRVFDAPCSEEALTGIALGMSLNRRLPILTHQRMDFLLACANQLVNTVAKWHEIYCVPTPMIIRSIIGRGWGQGCNHGQDLTWIFQRVEGLRVVVPSTPDEAYWFLQQAATWDTPVLFVEHRWLHRMSGEISDSDNAPVPDVPAIPSGELTLCACGYAYHLASRARNLLDQIGIYVPVLNTYGEYVEPSDNRIIVWEQTPGSILPAGPAQSDHYTTAEDIANRVLERMGHEPVFKRIPPHDQAPGPEEWM